MRMRIDTMREHTKRIAGMNGPIKKFPTKEGEREKYDIIFTDGYECEYCPLIHEVKPLPKIGQEIIFKVRHSGQYGDEIEILSGPAATAGPGKTQGPIVSMGGHPASIAIRAAVDLAAISGKHTLILDDVFSEADKIYEWLIRKAEGQ